MSRKSSQVSLTPPLQWPKDGVIKVRYENEIQDVWACRYGTLTELMKEGVARFGDREMLYFPDFNIRWNYNEFDTRVNNVSYCLKEDYGIQKGERVAIMMNNIPEAFVMYLALSQIGAISVIVNARLAADEALRQLADIIPIQTNALTDIGTRDVRTESAGLVLGAYGTTVVACRIAFARLPDRTPPRRLGAFALASLLLGMSLDVAHRALIVDEGWKSGSLSAEICARIVEQAFYDLDAPVQRLCRREVPIPYAKHLEDAAIPQVADIVAKAKEMLR